MVAYELSNDEIDQQKLPQRRLKPCSTTSSDCTDARHRLLSIDLDQRTVRWSVSLNILPLTKLQDTCQADTLPLNTGTLGQIPYPTSTGRVSVPALLITLLNNNKIMKTLDGYAKPWPAYWIFGVSPCTDVSLCSQNKTILSR